MDTLFRKLVSNGVIMTLPVIDPPEAFGQHSNADIASQVTLPVHPLQYDTQHDHLHMCIMSIS